MTVQKPADRLSAGRNNYLDAIRALERDEIRLISKGNGSELPLPLWERVGVRGYGLTIDRNPSPGSHLAMRSDLSHKGRGEESRWQAYPIKSHPALVTGLPRMLRSAVSAFTRVFDALCLRRGALLIRGPSLYPAGPGSAEQREGRCTAAGTRRFTGVALFGCFRFYL